jgi:hypothetical protein
MYNTVLPRAEMMQSITVFYGIAAGLLVIQI